MNAQIDISEVVLKTDRLLLRPWRETDLQDFFEYASVDGVGQMCGWTPHKDIQESKDILSHFIEEKREFAIECRGKVIGAVGAHAYSEEHYPELSNLTGCEIGYVLSKDYWGQGLMPEAVKAVIKHLFDVVKLDFKVYSRVAYASEGAFVEEIKDCLDCGIPISVCVFTDAAGKPMVSTNFIGEQGCLPCGYRTEPHPANGSADIKVVAKTLTWKIPVCWSMMATIEVEAATLAEAIEIAKDDNGEIPLPDGVFQDGSWEVDCSDKDYIRQWYNDDQADLDLSEAEDACNNIGFALLELYKTGNAPKEA